MKEHMNWGPRRKTTADTGRGYCKELSKTTPETSCVGSRIHRIKWLWKVRDRGATGNPQGLALATGEGGGVFHEFGENRGMVAMNTARSGLFHA